MRATILGAMGAAALGTCACTPVVNYDGVATVRASRVNGAPLRVLAALDCPISQGALTRTAQAADGRSCDYAGPDQETVRLSLVGLDGRPPVEALAQTRAELWALVPVAIEPVRPIDADQTGDRADIDLPFFHVHAVGDRADVRVFGVKVHADGDRADVHTNLGLKHTVVHAGPGGAEVIAENVGRTNAELVYVLASERRQPSGYSAVGYVAKGPVAGPLVMGEFHARHKRPGQDGNQGGDDMGRLIERNLKG
jgi:hypothetical protein